jgi:hypothetical protein
LEQAGAGLKRGINDLLGGYNENRTQKFSVDNWNNNYLDNGNKKGLAYRLGEGLGSFAKLAESPIGRSLLVGGIVGATGGDGLQALTYGAQTGMLNQQNRAKDQMYRKALADRGIDTSGIRGYVGDSMFKSILEDAQLRDNAEYRNAMLETQVNNQREMMEYRKQEAERQARQDRIDTDIAYKKLGLQERELAQRGGGSAKTQNVIKKNGAALAKIDALIDMLEKSKNKNDASYGATGFWQGAQAESNRAIAQHLNNNSTPEQIELRSQLSDLGSMTITDRSGTAQTVNELKRLRPFIADSYDRPETAIAKLKSMRNNIENETRYYMDSEGLSYDDFFKTGEQPQTPSVNIDRSPSVVKMKAPNGKIYEVPIDRIEEMKKKGGVVING